MQCLDIKLQEPLNLRKLGGRGTCPEPEITMEKIIKSFEQHVVNDELVSRGTVS